MRPSQPATILIAIATERVSGPLKGIFQCLRHLDRERYRAVLGFVRAKRATPSDAEVAAQDQHVPYEVLEQRYAFDWRLISHARELITKYRISLVQTHGYKTHVLGAVLKYLDGVPWVGFEHGWTAETWRVRLYHRADWLLRYADTVVAVSDELREQLQGLGVEPRKILRIHNTVEPDEGWAAAIPGSFRQAHGIPPDSPLISVVGRMTREKGQRVFLDSFRQLALAVPNAHAALVGDGPDAQHLADCVQASGLRLLVHLVGYQVRTGPVYRDSDVVVIPSVAFEGIPNVLLEAMAAGRPVIASRVGGIAEIVTHDEDALLVAPGDAHALANAIMRLIEDKALRDRIIDAATRRIGAHYTPAGRAEQISRVYASLLK